jgi:class 3 adenylate cyclase
VSRLQKKNLSQPDEVRSVGRGQLEFVEVGDSAIGRITYQPGWRWSEDLRPIVGTKVCEVRHVGVVLSGHLRIEMTDGSTIDLLPNDVYDIPPGHDTWVVGDEPYVSIDTVGRRNFGKPSRISDDRTLATILFTDLVSSTELLAQIGDRAWRDRLADYQFMATNVVEKFRGREVTTTGDGLLAVFDSPARAVRCAVELNAAAGEVGVKQRAGIHTGEVEMAGSDVRGIAVHLAARVAAAAGAGEVLISSTTSSLLAGSGLTTVSRGPQQLKGIEGPVELFAVARE